MSVRQANALKRTRRCLKCGRLMWTDRCHRICKKCRRRNEATPVRSPYLVSLPRGFEMHKVELYDREEW